MTEQQQQIEKMLSMMQKQMEQLDVLRTENNTLRTTTTTNNNPSGQQKPKTKAPDRPIVNTNTDEREWELFKDSWGRYKLLAGITDDNLIQMELRAACSQDVNKLLFEYVGAATLNSATEEELLTHIKSIAVKGTCKEVHRMNFFKIIQMEGETITQFVARLRAQAVLCQFRIEHTDSDGQIHLLSYVDDMVSQQLISGLSNHHHQTQVLSEASTLITLQAKIDKLQCLEATVSSTDQMRTTPRDTTPSTANPIRSSYKRDHRNRFTKRTPPTGFNNKSFPCKGCGRTSHEGKTMARKDCPAIDKFCGNCGIKGHFHTVCRKKNEPSHSNSANGQTEENIPDEDTSFTFSTQDFRLGHFQQEET